MTTEPIPQNDPGAFPANIQEEIAALLLTKDEELKKAVGLVRPEYFTNPPLQDIIRILLAYFEQYRCCPPRDHIQTQLDDLKDQRWAELRSEMLTVLYDVSAALPLEYSSDRLGKFCRYQATQKAILDCASLLQKNQDYPGIIRLITGAAEAEPEAARDERELESICAADVVEEEMEWFWHNTFPKAKLSLLVGKPGSGKSFFTMMMAARVSSGADFPTHSNRPVDRGQVLILQTEDGWADTCKKRLRWEGADQSRIHFLTGTKDRQGNTYPVDLSTDLKQVRQKMSELGDVKLIIVDPLSAYVGISAKMDSHQEREVRLALGPLMAFIEQERVAVVGIMHMNKNQMADALYRISGSAAWSQVPRVIWTIAKDREDPELRHFLIMKNNTVPEVEKREAEFVFRIQENHIVLAPDVQPIGLAEAVGPETPEDARERRGKLKTALTFLEDQKAKGTRELSAREVKQAYPEIGDNTWKQARRKMKVRTAQRMDGWWWLF